MVAPREVVRMRPRLPQSLSVSGRVSLLSWGRGLPRWRHFLTTASLSEKKRLIKRKNRKKKKTFFPSLPTSDNDAFLRCSFQQLGCIEDGGFEPSLWGRTPLLTSSLRSLFSSHMWDLADSQTWWNPFCLGYGSQFLLKSSPIFQRRHRGL